MVWDSASVWSFKLGLSKPFIPFFSPSLVFLSVSGHARHWPANPWPPWVSATPTEDDWHWCWPHFLLGKGVGGGGGEPHWPKAILFLCTHEAAALQGAQSRRTIMLGHDEHREETPLSWLSVWEMPMQGSVLAVGKCLACLEFMRK